MKSGKLFLLPVHITGTATHETLPAATIVTGHSCKRFLAENAKSARAFLKKIEHPAAISELEIIEIGHEPDAAQFARWLAPIKDGTDTAVVSESGCPAVADPGTGLVEAAHAAGIEVVPLVGPSSILLTLMASGMNGQRFRFLGYLPIEETARAKALRDLERESAATGETELFIETPYRNNRMLAAMCEILDASTKIAAATDVTGSAQSIVSKTTAAWNKDGFDLPKLPTVFALSARCKSTKPAHATDRPSKKPAFSDRKSHQTKARS